MAAIKVMNLISRFASVEAMKIHSVLFMLFGACISFSANAQSLNSEENYALGSLDDLILDANRVVISDQPFELSPQFVLIGENRIPLRELSEKNRGKPSRYFYIIVENKRLISKIQILKKFPASYYNENDEPN